MDIIELQDDIRLKRKKIMELQNELQSQSIYYKGLLQESEKEVKRVKRDWRSISDENVNLYGKIALLEGRLQSLEQGYKDILDCDRLGNPYSDISVAMHFQKIAREMLAK